MKKWWQVIAVVIAIIVLDQLTKYGIRTNFFVGESVKIIDGLFSLTYVQNTGAAFGFGANYQDWFRYTMFLALPVVAVAWLIWLVKETLNKKLFQCLAYTLIIGGAIGNLIDRFVLKYVVDMFDFYLGTSHFPAFNIADSAISIAAVILIIDFTFEEVNKKKEKEVKA